MPPEDLGRRRAASLRLAAVHQTAWPEGGRWRFVDEGRFAAPGATVEVQDLRKAGGATAAPGSHQLALDVVVGVGGAGPAFRLACHGEERALQAPCALLHIGDVARLEGVAGPARLVRILPEAPFGT